LEDILAVLDQVSSPAIESIVLGVLCIPCDLEEYSQWAQVGAVLARLKFQGLKKLMFRIERSDVERGGMWIRGQLPELHMRGILSFEACMTRYILLLLSVTDLFPTD
jgi:hypothetical protein